MKANEDVTAALRRTIALMQNELERSVLTTQMLGTHSSQVKNQSHSHASLTDDSTATLRSTSTIHDTMTSVMGTSKQLIVALEKSDWLDRLLILAGLAFFMLVVLFILKQRILDRGLRIAFWWTRFLPNFSGDAGSIMIKSGEVLSATASTALAATVPALSVLTVPSSSDVSRLVQVSESGMLESTLLGHVSEMLPSISTSTFPVSTTSSDVRTTTYVGGEVVHEEL
jgi:protein transport protein SEC20